MLYRRFMINHQDRILYGTDGSVHGNHANFSIVLQGLKNSWFEQWLFLATDTVLPVNDLGGQLVKGLQLPKEVIDKLYYKNAEKYFIY